MDRPPDDPTPEGPAQGEEPEEVEPAPPEPVSPYGPQTGDDAGDASTPDAAAPPAHPYEWVPPVSGENAPPAGPPEVAYPPVPRAPVPIGQTPMGHAPMGPPGGSGSYAEHARPGLGAGIATGCGLQVLALILFFVTAGLALGFFGALWPFILVTVGSALLMLSKRWRRFATGALIIAAAAWITIIGPCILILNGGLSSL